MPAQDENIDIGTPYTPRKPAPVVSVSINHPIAQMARKIKNFLTHKQTLFSTSFNIKVTPIVAIVSLFGIAALFGGGITTAFNFGKTVQEKIMSALPSPTPKIIIEEPVVMTVSKTGTIKATYLTNVIASEQSERGNLKIEEIASSITPRNEEETLTPTSTPNPTFTPTPTPRPVLHYILVSRSGSINYLASPNLNFQKYLNLRVLITGSFNSSNNTLTVSKSENIEILE